MLNLQINQNMNFLINFNSFYFQFSDVNYVNCNFKDDLLKLSFYGNYDYQGDTFRFFQKLQ